MSDTLYFGHRYGLQGVLSGVENLRYHCALRDQRPSEGQLVDALNQFQLGASMLSRVANLSEGQRKRVALSKLVFADEALWLLDEAFSSLDTEGLATLTALCAAHVAKGGTLLFTSHQSVSLSVPVRVIDFGSSVMREVLRREWLVASRSLGQLGQTLLFMLLVLTLFPRNITGTSGARAGGIGSTLDHESACDAVGSRADHCTRSRARGNRSHGARSVPLWWQVIAKVLMHWLTIGLPIVLVSPVIGLMLSVNTDIWPMMMLSLLLTTPILSLLCVFGAALTAGLGAGSALDADCGRAHDVAGAYSRHPVDLC